MAHAHKRACQLPRFFEHMREDNVVKTSMRTMPSNTAQYVAAGCSVRNGEIVEVVDRTGPQNGYVHVWLALTGQQGWVKCAYLKECPEGTRNHKRLTGEGQNPIRIEINPSDQRFADVERKIAAMPCTSASCPCKGLIKVKRLWFVTGHYLGETGMVNGPKETLFHGCKDNVVDAIATGGFDDRFSNAGSFGKGLYFSPQSCKAWSYGEWHLLLCEVALGKEGDRLTVTQSDPQLSYDYISQQGKRSVQCHAGAPFNHEERIVYRPTQCKPVYIVQTTMKSPGGGK